MDWLKTKGVIKVDRQYDRVAVNLPDDFVNYYRWFCERHLRVRLDIPDPKFGAHVTLGYKVLHPKLSLERAKQYHGKRVEFEYTNHVYIGGYRKGFVNCWLKVRSPELEAVRQHIRAFNDRDNQHLHVTVGNNKSIVALHKQQQEARSKGKATRRNPPHRPAPKEYCVLQFWPPLIEIGANEYYIRKGE